MIDRRIDFKDYLRSWNHRRFFDALRCIRRSAALQTPWREWQTAGALFNSLELHHTHRCAQASASVALIHTDATNRISWIRRDAAMASRAGHDLGEEMDLIFERYENELRCWAPLTWKRFQRVRASYFFLAGCRRSGVRQAMRCLARSPFSVEVWAQLILGLTGPRLYSLIRSRRRPPT